MNFNINMYDIENTTINATGLSILWCPSDAGPTGSVSDPYTYPNGYDLIAALNGSSKPEVMRYSSYAGCAGTWFNYQFGNIAPKQQNGVFYAFSVTKIASITDGTSNTIMFGEHTRAIENSYRRRLLALVDLGQLRRYDLHRILADQSPEEAALSAAPTIPGPRTASARCPACIRAGRMSPSATVRSGSSRSRSVAGPIIRRRTKPACRLVILQPPIGVRRHLLDPRPRWPRIGVWQKLATRNGGDLVSSDAY